MRTRTFLGLACLVGLATVSRALTIKSGNVSGETWPADTYWVTGDLQVDGATTLTIAPGCVVKCNPSVEFMVYGTLWAAGTAGSPIIFTSRDDNSVGTNVSSSDGDPNAGDWDGIFLYGYSTYEGVGYFDHCGLNYGGGATGSAQANLHFFYSDGGNLMHSTSAHSLAQGVTVQECSPQLTNTQFQTSGGHGLYVIGASAPWLTNCTFTGNAAYAAWIDTQNHTAYAGNAGGGNGVNGLGLAGTLSSSATWTMGAPDFPFVLGGDLVIADGQTLTLPPGAVVKSLPGVEITCYGSLSALGTLAAPIVFTSLKDDSHGGDTNADGAATSPAPGDWDGIFLYGYSTYAGVGNLDHCVLDYGGGVSGSAQANLHYFYSDSGVFLNSTSAHSLAQGVTVQSCSPAVTTSQIQGSGGHGLYVSGASSPLVTDNAFTGNASYAAWIDTQYHTTYAGNTGSGNGVNGLGLGGAVSSSATWTMGAPDFPFVLGGDLTIADDQTLTLPAGTVVKAAAGVEITCYGTLSAVGTVGDPIVFTSLKDDEQGGDTNADGAGSAPAAGDWDGIYCYGYGDYEGTGTFDHCLLAYGGGASGSAQANLQFFYSDSGNFLTSRSANSLSHGVIVQSCSPVLTSSIFQGSGIYGLYVLGASAPLLTNCSFTGSGSYAAWIDTQYHTSYSGNSGGGNGVNGLGLAGAVSSSATWTMYSPDFPFVLGGDLTIADNQTLTLPPGTVIKAAPAVEITCYGTLTALGTLAEPIVFTSLKDDSRAGDTNFDGAASTPAAGDWDGIYFYGYGDYDGIGAFDHGVLDYGGGASGSAQANLQFVYVDSGTFTNSTSAHSLTHGLVVQSSSPVLTGSQFQDSGAHGLYVTGTAAPLVTGCAFTDNASYAAWIDTQYHTSYAGNTGSGNGVNGLGLGGGVSASATWSMGAPDFSFVLGSDLTINDNQTLTLAPGTVVKAAGGVEIDCYGTLSAPGTLADPITFTSLLDDSQGGDTNADGAASSPAPGDWDGIFLLGYSDFEGVGLLEECRLAYGGGASGSPQSNLRFYYSDSSLIRGGSCTGSALAGMYVDGSSPVIEGCLITGNNGFGLVNWSGTPVLGAADGSVGGANGIYDNDGGGWQVVNYTTYTIEACHNYWVHESPVAIDQHLYDDDENNGYGPILFTPWLTATGAPNLVDIDAAGTSLSLRWMPAWGATGYRVYSSTDARTGYALDGSGVMTGTEWAAPLPAGPMRFYRVTALRAGDE